METAFEGIVVFSALLVAFGILATVGGIVEFFANLLEHRRHSRRDLLPPPNVRSQRRARQWRVPL